MVVGPFVVGVSDLRRRLALLIDEVDRGGHPLFITHHGVVAAVLISKAEYHARCPEDGGLRRPATSSDRSSWWRRALRQGAADCPASCRHGESGPSTVGCDFEVAQVLAEQGVDTELILTEEGWMTDDEG